MKYQPLYSAIWSLPLTNVKWHCDSWPGTVTSRPIRLSTNFMTLIPSLNFTELRVVSMEHFQRVWHASRERLPLRTPDFVLFECLHMLWLLRQVFPTLHRINVRTEIDLPDLREVSMEYLRRVWHAIIQHLSFRTPGSWDLLMFQLFRPDFPNLPCLYSTFYL